MATKTEDAMVETKVVSKLFVALAAALTGTMWMCRYSVGAITDVLEKELNTTSSGVGMLSSLYYITYVALQIPIGLILEVYASEFVLAVAGLMLAFGTLLFASTSSLGMAMFGRLLMGLGSAPIWIASISVVGHRFGNKRVSTVMGKVMFAGQIAIMASSTAQASVYSSYGNWRAVFYALASMALLSSLAIASLFVYETAFAQPLEDAKETQQQMDNVLRVEVEEFEIPDHLALDALALDMPMELTLPPSLAPPITPKESNESIIKDGAEFETPPMRATTSPLQSPRLRSPVLSPVHSPKLSPAQSPRSTLQRMRSVSLSRKSLQKRSECSKREATAWEKLQQSLKDTVANRQNAVFGVFYFGVMTTHFALGGLWLPPFLRVKFSYSRSTSTLLSALTFLATAIGAVAFSRTSNRLKLRRPVLGSAALVCCMFEFVIYAPESTHVAFVAAALLVAGLSVGVLPVLFASVRELNWYADCTESSMALVSTIGMLSGFVAQAAAGWLLDLNWKSRANAKTDDSGLRVYTVGDYASAFYVVHAGILICLLTAFAMRETHCKNVLP